MGDKGKRSFGAMTPDELEAHASNWEDQLGGSQPEDYDWQFLPFLPLDGIWPKERAEAYWDEERENALENTGDPGYWDHLLDEAIRDPIVIAFSPAERRSRWDGNHRETAGRKLPFVWSIWDGNHRAAACVLTGRKGVHAVVGIRKGMDPGDLPDDVREALMTVGKPGEPGRQR
jgi:hypothetical protein